MWQETEQGQENKNEPALQSMSLTDKYTSYILNYINFLSTTYPDAEYIFPSGVELFGSGEHM